MRSLAPLAMLALLWPATAEAAPCAPGTLASYVALGAGGCTVGFASFEAFGVLAVPFGATPIAPEDVFVTPVAPDPSRARLEFQLDAEASAGELLEILIGYTVSAPLLVAHARLALEGTSVTQDGVVTAVEDLCLAGSFDPGGPTGCTGFPLVMIAFDIGVDQDLLETLAFAPVGSLAVVKDIAVDGGLTGAAALVAASNEFVAPEPAAALLVAAGLLGLARRRRRWEEPRCEPRVS
jgi:hypothetical protein